MRFRRALPFALCVLLLIPKASAETTGAYHWGINGHPITNGHDMEQTSYTDMSIPAQLDLVAELGAGWYRCGLRAEDYAKNPDRFDELLTEAEKRKIRLLVVLLPSNSFWDNSASVEQVRNNGAAFAKTMASKYEGRVTHWELANELDNFALLRKGETGRTGKPWSWDEAPEGGSTDDYNTARYERVKAQLIGFHEGIKSVDPTAQTVVDTAGWLHFGLIERLVNEDHVTPFDILSWHWYSHMGPITNVQGKRNMIKFLKRYGKPLWMTEINLHSSQYKNDQSMAEYIRGTVAELGKNPGIDCLFIYELFAQPYLDANEASYGLIEMTQNAGKWQVKAKKPAFDAFREVIRP